MKYCSNNFIVIFFLILWFNNSFAQDAFFQSDLFHFESISDFQVNDQEVYPRSPKKPATVFTTDSTYVIVWYSEQNDSASIYGQLFKIGGEPIGENFQVRPDITAGYPDVASSGEGNFTITWVTRDDNKHSVVAQRYNGNLEPLGDLIKINDDNGNARKDDPVINAFAKGFVIAWKDERNDPNQTDFDIYAQRITGEGYLLGNNFKANDDLEFNSQFIPNVGGTPNGGFVITWSDLRNDHSDIYIQIYNADGTPIGNNLKVNDDNTTRWQKQSDVAMDPDGNFTVCWSDLRGDHWEIYAQRYDKNGNSIGSNFLVYDHQSSSNQQYPKICYDKTGKFTICWYFIVKNAVESHEYARCFSASGQPLGSIIKVNNNAISIAEFYPDITMNNNGKFVITWHQNHIYSQEFSNAGQPVKFNIKVDDDYGKLAIEQGRPDIAITNEGGIRAVWVENRNIYGKIISKNGHISGMDIELTETFDKTQSHDYPVIIVDKNDNLLVAWYYNDYTNAINRINMQRYSADFTPIGDRIMVNDSTHTSFKHSTNISIDENGNYIIVWVAYKDQQEVVFCQRFTYDDQRLGRNFIVSKTDAYFNIFPAAAINSVGEFLIIWTANSNDINNIYGQYFNSNGQRLGNNFLINDSEISGSYSSRPNGDLCVLPNDLFIVAWADAEKLYWQKITYDEQVMLLGDPYQFDNGMRDNNSISIDSDSNGDFILTWPRRRNTQVPQIYGKCFNNAYRPITASIAISNNNDASQSQPKVILQDAKVYTVWVDQRQPEFYMDTDIWMNVLVWDQITDLEWSGVSNLPHSIKLQQNCPNPFNPGTTIKYELPVADFVEISVYNLLGQKVVTLVSKEHPAGVHEVAWNASQFPSGVYFYQLKAGNDFTETRKMLLVR